MTPALVALCLFAAPKAPNKESVLVLELAGGGLSADVMDALDRAIREEVQAVPGIDLLPKPALDFEGMKLAAGCVDDGPSCFRKIGNTVGAGKVLGATVQGDMKRAQVKLLLVHVAGSHEETSLLELTEVGPESAIELGI